MKKVTAKNRDDRTAKNRDDRKEAKQWMAENGHRLPNTRVRGRMYREKKTYARWSKF